MKIYLAGPEVFLPDARAVLDRKAALARAHGFVPLSPGDLDLPEAATPYDLALAISGVNEGMMMEADGIIANLTPYRGLAADTGTVFELGFMCGQGKVVSAYTNVATGHFQRVADFYGGRVTTDEKGYKRGPDGLSLEDFDMADNLMLDGGIARRDGFFVAGETAPEVRYSDTQAFEQCLEKLAQRYLR